MNKRDDEWLYPDNLDDYSAVMTLDKKENEENEDE